MALTLRGLVAELKQKMVRKCKPSEVAEGERLVRSSWNQIKENPFALLVGDDLHFLQQEIDWACRIQLVRYMLLVEMDAWLLDSREEYTSTSFSLSRGERGKDREPKPQRGTLCAAFDHGAFHYFRIKRYNRPELFVEHLGEMNAANIPQGSILFFQRRRENESVFKQRIELSQRERVMALYDAWQLWRVERVMSKLKKEFEYGGEEYASSYWVPRQALTDALPNALWEGQALFWKKFAQRGEFVALQKDATVETNLATSIHAIAATGAGTTFQPNMIPYAQREVFDQFDETQRSAVRMAVENPVSVLIGGAGTGKTTVTGVVVHCLAARMPMITLAAPTGKAASRLGELAGRDAFTTHKLYYSESTTPHTGALILDEQSMQQQNILLGVLRRNHFTKLIFVGDVAQLPCIGPGRLLKDLLENTAFPRTELTKIYRTGSGGIIAENGQKIRKGEVNITLVDNAFHMVTQTSWRYDDIANTIKEEAMHIHSSTGQWPQVLVDVNNLGRKANTVLRDVICPLPCAKTRGVELAAAAYRTSSGSSSGNSGKYQFREGEVVINTHNFYYRVAKDHDALPGSSDGGSSSSSSSSNQLGKKRQMTISESFGNKKAKKNNGNPTPVENDAVLDETNSYVKMLVSNGEVGTVTKVGIGTMINEEKKQEEYDYADVEFPNETGMIRFRTKFISDTARREAAMCELLPAYAITVHKSQGSEYKRIIYAVGREEYNTKEKFYTAVTRAKEQVICVQRGPKSVAEAIRRRAPKRKSFLFR